MLIVVCGPSGSGKTTLADALAREVRIACLHKDAVKAALHDRLGVTTRDSVLLFRALVEQQLALGVDLIAEATFGFEDDARILRGWQEEHGVHVLCVVCEADDPERRRRLLGRERHPVHAEADRAVLERFADAPPFDASALPGDRLVIRTDRPVDVCVGEVVAHLRRRTRRAAVLAQASAKTVMRCERVEPAAGAASEPLAGLGGAVQREEDP